MSLLDDINVGVDLGPRISAVAAVENAIEEVAGDGACFAATRGANGLGPRMSAVAAVENAIEEAAGDGACFAATRGAAASIFPTLRAGLVLWAELGVALELAPAVILFRVVGAIGLVGM